MKEFKDEEGRPWRLALTVASALRVRDLVTVDVVDDSTGETKQVPLDIVDAGSIAQTFNVFRSQFAKIGEILYAMLIRQIEDRKLSKDEFLDGLRGDSLEAAARALEAELVDFFPSRLRKMTQLLGAKMDEVQTEMLGRAEAQMQAATVESLAASGMPFGKPPESSESIQASGHSDNSSSLETAA